MSQRPVSATSAIVPTICASSSRSTPTIPPTAVRSCNCTPAATRSYARAWARGSLTDWGRRTRICPGFITICPTLGHGGVQNWSSAFLPAAFQGTPIGHAGMKCKDAKINNVTTRRSCERLERMQLDLLKQINQMHLERSGPGPAARRSHQLIRTGFSDANRSAGHIDISNEIEGDAGAVRHRRTIGPTTSAGNACWPAASPRRACAFIALHAQLQVGPAREPEEGTPHNAMAVDKPIAGLLTDLKRRGLLEDTLVWWGGEFGRTPFAQGTATAATTTRTVQHVAGRRRRRSRASTYGATDEFGYYAVGEQSPHARSARDDSAPAGPGPRTPDVPLRGPRFPADGRFGACRQRSDWIDDGSHGYTNPRFNRCSWPGGILSIRRRGCCS